MLLVSLALVGVSVRLFLQSRPFYSGGPYGKLLVPVLLLVNHLAFSFRWPFWLTLTLRLLSLVLMVFTFYYLRHLSNALFP